jgi:hypothetical protein
MLLFRVLPVNLSARSVKDLRDLFQAPALCLGEDHVRDGQEDNKKTTKDNIVLPAKVLHTNWVHESRNYQRAVDGQQFASDALGSKRIREDLSGVRHQERGICDIVVEVEREETHDDDVAGRLVVLLVVDSRARRPDDVGDQHPDAAPDEQGAATQTVDEEGCTKGGGEVEDLKQPVDERLVEGVGDADGVEHKREVVADNTCGRVSSVAKCYRGLYLTDSVPLGESTQTHGDKKAFAVARGCY